jgi:hypothetical protein
MVLLIMNTDGEIRIGRKKATIPRSGNWCASVLGPKPRGQDYESRAHQGAPVDKESVV